MPSDFHSQSEGTDSPANNQSGSVSFSTFGSNRLPDRSSFQTPASDRDYESEVTVTQGSNVSFSPTAGARKDGPLPLGPAPTDDILAWPVAGIQYGSNTAYESLPNGTVVPALCALVNRYVAEELGRGPRLDHAGFLIFPRLVAQQHSKIKVTMLREVVLGIYFDLPFAVQGSTEMSWNTMKGIQNAINESWKTRKGLTAQAVSSILIRKGFKVLEINCDNPHHLIWARYRHPNSDDQHIVGYFYAAASENA